MFREEVRQNHILKEKQQVNLNCQTKLDTKSQIKPSLTVGYCSSFSEKISIPQEEIKMMSSSTHVTVNKRSKGLRKSGRHQTGRRSASTLPGGLNKETNALQIVTKQAQQARSKSSSILLGKSSLLSSILHLMVILLILMVVLVDKHAVCAMSKRFLKGFIMGAMFAHHHKP